LRLVRRNAARVLMDSVLRVVLSGLLMCARCSAVTWRDWQPPYMRLGCSGTVAALGVLGADWGSCRGLSAFGSGMFSDFGTRIRPFWSQAGNGVRTVRRNSMDNGRSTSNRPSCETVPEHQVPATVVRHWIRGNSVKASDYQTLASCTRCAAANSRGRPCHLRTRAQRTSSAEIAERSAGHSLVRQAPM
jgi:hypothetical protein